MYLCLCAVRGCCRLRHSNRLYGPPCGWSNEVGIILFHSGNCVDVWNLMKTSCNYRNCCSMENLTTITLYVACAVHAFCWLLDVQAGLFLLLLVLGLVLALIMCCYPDALCLLLDSWVLLAATTFLTTGNTVQFIQGYGGLNQTYVDCQFCLLIEPL